MRRTLASSLAVLLLARAGSATEPVDLVNTGIGRISHMLVPVFPAVQRPNCLLRFVPPTESFTTDRISGFGLTVPSHRRGPAFSVVPWSGDPSALPRRWTSRHDHEDARPYRYSVWLDDHDVTVEAAPGCRAAVWSATFEGPAAERFLLLRPREKGSLRVEGATITGTDDLAGATAYLYAQLDPAPSRAGAFAGDRADFSLRETRDSAAAVVAAFPASVRTVRVRYGISYVSAEQARKSLEAEVRDFDLERLAREARAAWNETLGRVEVEGGTEAERRVFYTALYRSHERMVQVSEGGRYWSAWDGAVRDDAGVPYWTDDWSWDTFHALHPLNVLLHPAVQSQKLQSYVRACEPSGWMPTFPTIAGDLHAMNGLHPAAIFADALAKGVDGFDAERAYQCLKKTMREESLVPWYRGPATELDRFYWEKGFFPALRPGEAETVKEVTGERRQAVAVTLAAAYDNWCLSRIARHLGHAEDAALFRERAFDYRNLWKADTAFFHPKDRNGEWILPFDYKYSGGPGARDYYDENNAWTYRWEVYHNVADLVALFGGRDAFVEKLDRTFAEGYDRPRWEFYGVQPDSSGNVGMFVMGNEPSFHVPYLYDFVGQPWKTQKRVRMLLEAWFRDDLMGIPGDEDGGGMSAFVVFSMIGLYPTTPGQPVYAFGSPVFRKVTIHLENGNTFVVSAPAADRSHKYIQSVSVNGQPWSRTWIPHEVVANGGTVALEMGDRPNRSWGTGADAAPPSEGAP
jgi:predicted alpha-1,2-mannosidase